MHADPKPRLCAVTGRRAEYRMPLTGVAYSDAAAYRSLLASGGGGGLRIG